ncbi:MAG: hypothetical protein IJ725_01775, partial [Ruminococcus sp.]|nr:hypothetical protein [Ruminococcus sp.]
MGRKAMAIKMKKIKKTICLLLTVLMLLSAFTVTSFATDSKSASQNDEISTLTITKTNTDDAVKSVKGKGSEPTGASVTLTPSKSTVNIYTNGDNTAVLKVAAAGSGLPDTFSIQISYPSNLIDVIDTYWEGNTLVYTFAGLKTGNSSIEFNLLNTNSTLLASTSTGLSVKNPYITPNQSSVTLYTNGTNTATLRITPYGDTPYYLSMSWPRSVNLYNIEVVYRYWEDDDSFVFKIKGVRTGSTTLNFDLYDADYDEDEILIKDGRHPVIEKMLPSKEFVDTDTYLDTNNDRFSIITGPNMAGKSTYMRQVALITVMAQIGSFVPASY